MEKKIIFLDIDGTFTPSGTNVAPESAVAAVKKARENGHIVFLCTGRNRGMLSPVLKYGFDGYIGSAGGYIVCGDEVIFDCPMLEEQRRGVMDALEKENVFCTVETLDDTYTDDGFKLFLEANASKGGNSELLRWRKQLESNLNILSMTKYKEEPVYKIIMMCQDELQLQAAREKYEKDFLFCIQEKDKYGIVNGELINRKFDKGQAVQRVCEYFGISLENAYAFGDSMNDKEMIEMVPHSICMANGSETLKALASDVCDCVENDGIAKAFEKYGLI